ncbi:MAG TPA: hypothetical protein VGP79_13695 [Bryobacteraceae bacterium]|jgi:hypothetical protein|nr:hypothetical protein [Bryobacteraceae bacterium]
MAILKKVELAHAKRVLRRLEEDAPVFKLRIAELPPEAQAISIRQFESALLEQKALIQNLETQINSK